MARISNELEDFIKFKLYNYKDIDKNFCKMFGTEETKVGFHLEAREGLLTYVKEAPRFSDILHDSIQRGKQIVSSYVIPYRRDRASRKVEKSSKRG